MTSIPDPTAKPHRSISARLVAVSALIALLVSAIAMGFLLYRVYRAEIELANQRLDAASSVILPSLQLALWEFDERQLILALDGIRTVPGVAEVVLVSTDGRRWHTGAPIDSPLFQREFDLASMGPDDPPLGRLSVSVGFERVQERVRAQAISLSIIVLIAVFGSALLFSLLFRLRVARHLETMATYAANLRFDIEQPELVLQRRSTHEADELDQVASAMNLMRSRVIEFVQLKAEYERGLIRQQEILEAQVEERTRELARKAHELEIAHAAESAARSDAEREAERLADFAGVAADGFWETDAELRLIYMSPWAAQVLGLDPDHLIGLTPESAYRHAHPKASFGPQFMAPLRARTDFSEQMIVARGNDGTRRWLVNQARARHDGAGAFLGFRGTISDITASHEGAIALKASESRLRLITDNLPALISCISPDHVFTFNNLTYERWLSRPLTEITGQPVRSLYGDEVYARIQPPLDQAFAGERVTFELQNGGRIYRVTYLPSVESDGSVSQVYGLAHDITRLKDVEQELRTLAERDALTGLPNRRQLETIFPVLLRRSVDAGARVALMFLDLDRFKSINDRHGHGVGDQVLRTFSDRLVASVRHSDIVARLAGDEFVILLGNIRLNDEAERVALNIIAAMKPKLLVDGIELAMSTTIGIAFGVTRDDTLAKLLHVADQALYRAKAAERGTFAFGLP